MKKTLAIFILAIILLFTAMLYQYFTFNDGKLHIVICDVGQGDAIFIRTPKGEDVIIDGGPDDKILSCLSSHMPFWDRSIEAVFLTHPHADHLTGLISVLERYSVSSFNTEKVPGSSVIYRKLMTILAEKNLSARYLNAGNVFSEDKDLIFTTEWPSKSSIESMGSVAEANIDQNGFSVIELLRYKSFKALFTGDAGFAVEDEIASSVGKIDLLKVPHHGSRTGMSASFLAKTMPSLAVISVGFHNRYGHPAPFSLDLLQKLGVKTLRTDQNGEVEIISDGDKFSYKTVK